MMLHLPRQLHTVVLWLSGSHYAHKRAGKQMIQVSVQDVWPGKQFMLGMTRCLLLLFAQVGVLLLLEQTTSQKQCESLQNSVKVFQSAATS
jgi:hypothetical protein